MGRSRRPQRPRPPDRGDDGNDDETRWVSPGAAPAKGAGKSTVKPLDTDGLLADHSEPGTRPIAPDPGDEPETELMLPTPRAFRGRDSETVAFLKAPEPDPPPRAASATPKRTRKRSAKATTVLIDSDLTQLRSKPMPRRRRPKAKAGTPKRSSRKAREAKAPATPKRRPKVKRKEIPIDSSSSRIFNPDLSDPLLQRLATGFMVIVTIFVCLLGGALLGTLL